MEVILREDVQHLGAAGDVVKVKDGYARNYLLPRGLAYPATDANKRKIAFEATRIAKQRAAEKGAAAATSRDAPFRSSSPWLPTKIRPSIGSRAASASVSRPLMTAMRSRSRRSSPSRAIASGTGVARSGSATMGASVPSKSRPSRMPEGSIPKRRSRSRLRPRDGGRRRAPETRSPGSGAGHAPPPPSRRRSP